MLAVLVAEPDITLAALSARLLAERGVRADTSMLSRFFSGEGISFYDSRRIAERLQTVFGADQGHREPPFRESALFALKFDMRGRMVEDSFVLSSEAWVIGRVLARGGTGRGASTRPSRQSVSISSHCSIARCRAMTCYG